MVSIDLDSPYDETKFSPGMDETTKLNIMKQDDNKANAILGEVVDEAAEIAEWGEENRVPIIGVFSGFGIHIHLLYRPQKSATDHLISTVELLKETLDVDTLDRRIIGDTRRLMRVPNCPRVNNGKQTFVYTIPLSRDELMDLSASEILEMSTEPRPTFDPGNIYRPAMKVYDDYLVQNTEDLSKITQDNVNTPSVDDESFEWYVKQIIPLPCLAERIMQPDPDHKIRMAVASFLFETGWSREDVFDLYSQMAWVDFNPSVTRKQLTQIYRRGYASPSCETLQKIGKCVYTPDTREDCPTHQISGGDGKY